MCFGGGGKAQVPEPTPVPEAIAAPKSADAAVKKAGDDEKAKASALAGQNIKTSARGLGMEATTQKKKLLGQ